MADPVSIPQADDARDRLKAGGYHVCEGPSRRDVRALIAGYDERGERITTLETDPWDLAGEAKFQHARAVKAEADLAALRDALMALCVGTETVTVDAVLRLVLAAGSDAGGGTDA